MARIKVYDKNTQSWVYADSAFSTGGNRDVTAESITNALGYMPASEAYVSQLSEKIDDALNNNIVEQTVNVPLYRTGAYVYYSGSIADTSSFNIYGPIELKAGDVVRFTAKGYEHKVAILACVDDTFTSYTTAIQSQDSDVHDFEYTVLISGNYVFSSNKDNPVTTCVVSSAVNEIDELNERVNAVEKKIGKNDVFAFVNVGVIGDSLASGASNHDDGAADCPAYSWGKYIEREHGIPATLFSKGGATTRSWLSSNWGLTAMQAAEPCDCYIIGLGVNDKYALGLDYLGSSADVTVGNEDNNADTFYGNYSKIIAALIEKSPRCKIFCLTMPSTQSAPASTFNVAIRDIVGLYNNAHLIDLENDDYYGGSEYTALWNVAHSTAAGYKAMADHLWKRINAYMQDNLSEFTDIQWILEDREVYGLFETIKKLSEKIAANTAALNEIGTQEDIVQQVIIALGTPVFGRVDADKNITLTATNLAEGTYTYYFEGANGERRFIGTDTVEGEPTYTNVLPLAINADGTPYVGTNGEKGYKAGYRLNSSGLETAEDGAFVTGFIPANFGDRIYLGNISFYNNPEKTNKCYVITYDASFNKIGMWRDSGLVSGQEWAINNGSVVMDGNNMVSIVIANGVLGETGTLDAVKYIRVSAWSMSDESIITLNEPIE